MVIFSPESAALVTYAVHAGKPPSSHDDIKKNLLNTLGHQRQPEDTYRRYPARISGRNRHWRSGGVSASPSLIFCVNPQSYDVIKLCCANLKNRYNYIIETTKTKRHN